MKLDTIYGLSEGVQVRKEVFGLLFYDYRGPRLYFVPSRDLIPDSFFEGRKKVSELMEETCAKFPKPRQWVRDQLTQVLEKLEGKGLIYGKSIR